MVFLIQNSQNRDAGAMQAKLDEMLRALDKAREGFIGIEHLSDAEIAKLRDALERECGQRDDNGKAATSDDTVEHLLQRH
jgi:low affinity Fe/Cu permease